ncbi:unnamed protein product [Brassica oleracea var. botrytis]|uniref:Uncharacterized protein n=2 Tax=Brassica oleracea TaxID=3712 RepID=A0A0D3AFX6_BRAOL|nr:unnamed protein product [Brassica oleracea]
MTSSSSLSVITFLLFVHLSLSRESSPQIPSVTKSLFTLVRTIHTGSKGEGSRFRLTLTPRKVLIQRRKKNNKTVVPRIKVKIVRSYIDKKMIFGNDLTIDNGEIEVENGRRKHIVSGVVVLLAPQVRAQGLGLCNKTCQQYGLTVNDIIKVLAPFSSYRNSSASLKLFEVAPGLTDLDSLWSATVLSYPPWLFLPWPADEGDKRCDAPGPSLCPSVY